MKTTLLVTTGLLTIIIVSWFLGPRLLKTGWLIYQIDPYEKQVPGAPTILVLGDSTGYGTGASQSENSIAGLISRDYSSYSIENNSVNGRTISDLKPLTVNIYDQYKMILLQIGGNDILQNREVSEVEIELKEIISNLSDNTDSIVMMSSGNVGGASTFNAEQSKRYESITRDFRSMFIRVADETEIDYVDLFLEPADDPFVSQPNTYLSIDGLHPSDTGYAYWYQKLKPILDKHLD
jgi:lysophospholipase L1-like esterase